MPRNVLIEFRRDTAANWTAANPTLASGEPGWETNTGKLKIGDGSTAWNSLAYFGGSGGVTSLDSITGAVSLVAGSNVTITDNSPSAGDITIAASATGGGCVQIFHSELASDAASIDTGANAIPATYTNLLILCKMRTDEAVVNSLAKVNFNNDSSAIYDRFAVTWNGTAVAAGSAYGQTTLLMDALGNSADAHRFAVFRAFLIDYADTTQWKQVEVSDAEIGTASNANVRTAMGQTWTYRSTSAINQITLAHSGGTVLKTGSSMTIYGLS